MNRALKYLLLSVGAVGAILVALGAYLALSFNPNDYKPQIVRLVKQKYDRTLAISGDIKLSFFPTLGAELGGLTLSEQGSDKTFATVAGARASLRLLPLLSRQLMVSRIEVRGLRAQLVKHKDGSSNFDDLAGSAAREAEPASPGENQPAQKPIRFSVDRVLVDNAMLSYQDEGRKLKYSLDRLTVKVGPSGDVELATIVGASQPRVNVAIRLKGKFTYAVADSRFKMENLDFGAKGEVAGVDLAMLSLKGQLDGDERTIDSPGLVLEIDAKSGAKTLKGKLTSPLAFDPQALTVDLNKLVADLAYSDARSARAPLTIKLSGRAHADIPRQRASLAFTAGVDGSSASGTVGLDHFSPPSYVFDVNVDRLDVDRYTGVKEPVGQGIAVDAKAPQPVLDFSPLKSLQAKGSLKVGALKFAQLEAQNVRLKLQAGGGRLEVKPFSGSLYQGTMNGSLSLLASTPPQIAIEQQLVGISIGPLLRDAIGKDLLTGRGELAFDVSGRGATLAAIKKAMNGRASLSLVDGALKGINIAATIRAAKAGLGTLKGETSQPANSVESTDFTELKASFAIRNGIAHNSDLSLKSPLLRLGGDGDIDIGAGSLDYLAKATLVATAAGQGGKEAAELAGLTIPVRISGPFAKLRYKLDFDAMLKGVAQQKIDAKKEELKTKLQDRLKDQLKGLFGR